MVERASGVAITPAVGRHEAPVDSIQAKERGKVFFRGREYSTVGS